MPASLIISNHSFSRGQISGDLGLTFAGIGSYFAHSFWAYDSQTINRIAISFGAITNRLNYNITVGIGTVNRSIGLPALEGGTGNTLIYNSSSIISGSAITQNLVNIFSIPDFTTTQYEKYFIGLTISAVTGTFSHETLVKGTNDLSNTLNSSPFYHRLSGSTIINSVYDTDRFSAINWGYDSGNGITSWYNPFPGPTRYSSVVNVTTSNIVGFTFTLDSDFSSIYVKNVLVPLRNPSSAFPTGFGCTWHCVLYDSDGTTALIANTFSTYSANASQLAPLTLPLNYWLSSKKLYHIGFAGNSAVSPTLTQMVFCDMPYQYQSALGFTSIYFTKAGGAGAPSYTSTRVVPFALMISDIRGSVQGDPGDQRAAWGSLIGIGGLQGAN